MNYTLLGNSGLNISKYSLGTIPFSGTKGAGALLIEYWYKNGLNIKLHHESGSQNGTGNAPGIAVMASAFLLTQVMTI